MRVSIIGNSGSGKSTLAHRLRAMYACAVLDLDTIAWEPDKVAVPSHHGIAVTELARFCDSHQHWAIEGCYTGLTQVALQRSPVLLFLDPGVDACLTNCRGRPWEPHKYRSKREQDEKLEFLLEWVRQYYVRADDCSLAAHQALFAAYQGAKYTFTRGTERDELDKLADL
jgi:adenylate kinase family enzyme